MLTLKTTYVQMKKTMGLLMVCLTLCVAVQAQSKEEKEVAAAVENLRKAMIDANKAQLEKLAADELTYGHSSGTIEDKDTFVEALISGKSDFETMDLSDQTIKIVGNTALVRHNLSAKVKNSGTPGTANLGILLVWQKQGGNWKLLARQAFKL